MNEFDDIDRELDQAFAERPSVLSRPSLRDVKRRARRHQRQRSAGVLGACAIVGVGGAAVLATRSPANQTTLGEGDATATTICFPTATTIGYYEYDSSSAPATTLGDIDGDGVGDRFYEVLVGDNPTSVAAIFGVTLEALNEFNVNTPDYETFHVGLVIRIPASSVGTTTTSPGVAIAGDYTLQSGDYPAKVAEMFHITVAQLDAANVDVNGYSGFIVGTKINIPEASQFADTTTTNVGTAVPPTTLFPEPSGYTAAVTVFDPMSVYPTQSVTDANCVPTDGGSTTTTSIEALTGDVFVMTKRGTAVQVANCSNQEGVARYLSDQLVAEGFVIVEPDTCTIDLPVTKVIYDPNDPIALDVAKTVAIYLNNAIVEASGSPVPTLATGTWVPGSGVIVLLGDDLAGKTLAEIAIAASPTTIAEYTPNDSATSTTCFEASPPQMTLPPPATSTTMPGSC